MSKLKKMLKKAGKAAAIAGAASGASKALSQRGQMKEFLKTEGGDKSPVSYITKKAKPQKTSMFKKILNMGPGPNATSKMGGTLADKVLSRPNTGMEMFGGAKMGAMVEKKMYGGMMKAKSGTYVKASCKLGKNKKTLIT
jgi:hypothetical protein